MKIGKCENVGIKTQEGADAYEECAKFLRTAESADETLPSKGLTKIANELLEVVQKDASQINTVDMSAIIDKYGSFTGAFNRVMDVEVQLLNRLLLTY